LVRATVDGTRLEFDLVGAGPLVTVTPGGRFDRHTPGIPELAARLADRCTVLTWDRPNCGGSAVRFDGTTESEMWADVLAGLVEHIDVGPAVACGGSAGARVSLLAVQRHPSSFQAAVVWWVSGGVYARLNLGQVYVLPVLRALQASGVDDMLELPDWSALVRRSPENGEIIRRLGAGALLDVFERWAGDFLGDSAVVGLATERLRSIDRPVLVLSGGPSDFDHPVAAAAWVAEQVPLGVLASPPWPQDEWPRRCAIQAESDDGSIRLFEGWPQAADVVARAAGHGLGDG